MTDPRAVAVKLLGDIAVGPRDSAEFYIELVVKALADAERRGIERAATVVEGMYLKPERIWDADTLDGAINAIRAKAHADQEAHDEG